MQLNKNSNANNGGDVIFIVNNNKNASDNYDVIFIVNNDIFPIWYCL